MASVGEGDCHKDPNFAVICSFLDKYGSTLGLPPVTYSDLQTYLEDTTNDVSRILIDIHVRLLRRIGKSTVNSERFEKSIIKFCHNFSEFDAWEVESYGYKHAQLSTKLRILKNLLECQFDYNLKFKEKVNESSAEDMRFLPIGRDKEGQAYWYFLDQDSNLLVYREEQDDEDADTWQLVCSTRNQLADLVNTLKQDSKVESKEEDDKTSSSESRSSKEGSPNKEVTIQQVNGEVTKVKEEKINVKEELQSSVTGETVEIKKEPKETQPEEISQLSKDCKALSSAGEVTSDKTQQKETSHLSASEKETGIDKTANEEQIAEENVTQNETTVQVDENNKTSAVKEKTSSGKAAEGHSKKETSEDKIPQKEESSKADNPQEKRSCSDESREGKAISKSKTSNEGEIVNDESSGWKTTETSLKSAEDTIECVQSDKEALTGVSVSHEKKCSEIQLDEDMKEGHTRFQDTEPSQNLTDSSTDRTHENLGNEKDKFVSESLKGDESGKEETICEKELDDCREGGSSTKSASNAEKETAVPQVDTNETCPVETDIRCEEPEVTQSGAVAEENKQEAEDKERRQEQEKESEKGEEKVVDSSDGVSRERASLDSKKEECRNHTEKPTEADGEETSGDVSCSDVQETTTDTQVMESLESIKKSEEPSRNTNNAIKQDSSSKEEIVEKLTGSAKAFEDIHDDLAAVKNDKESLVASSVSEKVNERESTVETDACAMSDEVLKQEKPIVESIKSEEQAVDSTDKSSEQTKDADTKVSVNAMKDKSEDSENISVGDACEKTIQNESLEVLPVEKSQSEKQMVSKVLTEEEKSVEKREDNDRSPIEKIVSPQEACASETSAEQDKERLEPHPQESVVKMGEISKEQEQQSSDTNKAENDGVGNNPALVTDQSENKDCIDNSAAKSVMEETQTKSVVQMSRTALDQSSSEEVLSIGSGDVVSKGEESNSQRDPPDKPASQELEKPIPPEKAQPLEKSSIETDGDEKSEKNIAKNEMSECSKKTAEKSTSDKQLEEVTPSNISETSCHEVPSGSTVIPESETQKVGEVDVNLHSEVSENEKGIKHSTVTSEAKPPQCQEVADSDQTESVSRPSGAKSPRPQEVVASAECNQTESVPTLISEAKSPQQKAYSMDSDQPETADVPVITSEEKLPQSEEKESSLSDPVDADPKVTSETVPQNSEIGKAGSPSSCADAGSNDQPNDLNSKESQNKDILSEVTDDITDKRDVVVKTVADVSDKKPAKEDTKPDAKSCETTKMVNGHIEGEDNHPEMSTCIKPKEDKVIKESKSKELENTKETSEVADPEKESKTAGESSSKPEIPNTDQNGHHVEGNDKETAKTNNKQQEGEQGNAEETYKSKHQNNESQRKLKRSAPEPANDEVIDSGPDGKRARQATRAQRTRGGRNAAARGRAARLPEKGSESDDSETPLSQVRGRGRGGARGRGRRGGRGRGRGGRKLKPEPADEDGEEGVSDQTGGKRAKKKKPDSSSDTISEEEATPAKKGRNQSQPAAKSRSRGRGGRRGGRGAAKATPAPSKEEENGKRRSLRVRQLKARRPPTSPSEESSETSSEEETEEEGRDKDFLDASFTPEEESGDEEFRPRGRNFQRQAARTNKEDEVVNDDTPCVKCGKYNHPEMILLCDKCDAGYHTACLRPPLMLIPDGDWFCPPCEHAMLVSKLLECLQSLDNHMKKKDRLSKRQERLAYVGISISNILHGDRKVIPGSKFDKEGKQVITEEEEPEDEESREGGEEERDSEATEEEESGSSSYESEAEQTRTYRSQRLALREAQKRSRKERHKRRRGQRARSPEVEVVAKRTCRTRNAVSYQFKEFDELISNAIEDDKPCRREKPPVTNSRENHQQPHEDWGISRGKDMSNILGASDEEDEKIRQRDGEIVPPPVVKKKPKRKLTLLESDEEDAEEEEDSEEFKLSEEEDSEATEIEGEGEEDEEDEEIGSSDSGAWKPKKTWYNSRTVRPRRKIKDFVVDDDEYDSDENARKRRSTRNSNRSRIHYDDWESEDETEEEASFTDESSEDSSYAKKRRGNVRNKTPPSKKKATKAKKEKTGDASDDGQSDSSIARKRKSLRKLIKKRRKDESESEESRADVEEEKKKGNERKKRGKGESDDSDFKLEEEQDSEEQSDGESPRFKKKNVLRSSDEEGEEDETETNTSTEDPKVVASDVAAENEMQEVVEPVVKPEPEQAKPVGKADTGKGKKGAAAAKAKPKTPAKGKKRGEKPVEESTAIAPEEAGVPGKVRRVSGSDKEADATTEPQPLLPISKAKAPAGEGKKKQPARRQRAKSKEGIDEASCPPEKKVSTLPMGNLIEQQQSQGPPSKPVGGKKKKTVPNFLDVHSEDESDEQKHEKQEKSTAPVEAVDVSTTQATAPLQIPQTTQSGGTVPPGEVQPQNRFPPPGQQPHFQGQPYGMRPGPYPFPHGGTSVPPFTQSQTGPRMSSPQVGHTVPDMGAPAHSGGMPMAARPGGPGSGPGYSGPMPHHPNAGHLRAPHPAYAGGPHAGTGHHPYPHGPQTMEPGQIAPSTTQGQQRMPHPGFQTMPQNRQAPQGPHPGATHMGVAQGQQQSGGMRHPYHMGSQHPHQQSISGDKNPNMGGYPPNFGPGRMPSPQEMGPGAGGMRHPYHNMQSSPPHGTGQHYPGQYPPGIRPHNMSSPLTSMGQMAKNLGGLAPNMQSMPQSPLATNDGIRERRPSMGSPPHPETGAGHDMPVMKDTKPEYGDGEAIEKPAGKGTKKRAASSKAKKKGAESNQTPEMSSSPSQPQMPNAPNPRMPPAQMSSPPPSSHTAPSNPRLPPPQMSSPPVSHGQMPGAPHNPRLPPAPGQERMLEPGQAMPPNVGPYRHPHQAYMPQNMLPYQMPYMHGKPQTVSMANMSPQQRPAAQGPPYSSSSHVHMSAQQGGGGLPAKQESAQSSENDGSSRGNFPDKKTDGVPNMSPNEPRPNMSPYHQSSQISQTRSRNVSPNERRSSMSPSHQGASGPPNEQGQDLSSGPQGANRPSNQTSRMPPNSQAHMPPVSKNLEMSSNIHGPPSSQSHGMPANSQGPPAPQGHGMPPNAHGPPLSGMPANAHGPHTPVMPANTHGPHVSGMPTNMHGPHASGMPANAHGAPHAHGMPPGSWGQGMPPDSQASYPSRGSMMDSNQSRPQGPYYNSGSYYPLYLSHPGGPVPPNNSWGANVPGYGPRFVPGMYPYRMNPDHMNQGSRPGQVPQGPPDRQTNIPPTTQTGPQESPPNTEAATSGDKPASVVNRRTSSSESQSGVSAETGPDPPKQVQEPSDTLPLKSSDAEQEPVHSAEMQKSLPPSTAPSSSPSTSTPMSTSSVSSSAVSSTAASSTPIQTVTTTEVSQLPAVPSPSTTALASAEPAPPQLTTAGSSHSHQASSSTNMAPQNSWSMGPNTGMQYPQHAGQWPNMGAPGQYNMMRPYGGPHYPMGTSQGPADSQPGPNQAQMGPAQGQRPYMHPGYPGFPPSHPGMRSMGPGADYHAMGPRPGYNPEYHGPPPFRPQMPMQEGDHHSRGSEGSQSKESNLPGGKEEQGMEGNTAPKAKRAKTQKKVGKDGSAPSRGKGGKGRGRGRGGFMIESLLHKQGLEGEEDGEDSPDMKDIVSYVTTDEYFKQQTSS